MGEADFGTRQRTYSPTVHGFVDFLIWNPLTLLPRFYETVGLAEFLVAWLPETMQGLVFPLVIIIQWVFSIFMSMIVGPYLNTREDCLVFLSVAIVMLVAFALMWLYVAYREV